MENHSDELQPTVLLYVLGLVDHTRWAAKAGIVGVIGSQEGGDWLSSNDVALLCGMSAARARVYLRELERDRVVFRAAGGGCQPFWCRVNPDVLAWRNVPWKLDPADLAIRIAFHEEHARASTTAGERFNARPRGARRRDFFARSRAARQQIEERRSTRAPGARGERIVEMLQRAPQGRATPDASTRALGRAENGARSSIGVPTADVRPQSAIDEASGASGPAPTEEDPQLLERARKVVVSRSAAGPKGRWINGAPLERLRLLVVEHGEDLVDAAERVPANRYQVPVFLDQLLIELAGDVDNAGGDPSIDLDRRLSLHDRIDNLARLIATAEQHGDEEHAGDLRNELQTCENELETIGGAL